MKDLTYSKYFNINYGKLKKYSIFNGFINKDAQYYILPYKLEDIKIPEFKDSYQKYKKYFNEIVLLLENSTGDDLLFRKAEKRFNFHEFGHIGLGYSINTKNGSGIGKKFAKQLAQSSLVLVKAGIKNPEIFQFVSIFEEGIGADRISDMTISILKEDFLLYTQRVAKELNLSISTFVFNNTKYDLPFNENKKPVIFCPNTILTKLPLAFDASDIEDICSHNEELRNKLNEIIGNILSKATKTIIKRELKKFIIHNPSIANNAVALYKKKGLIYDFSNDPEGEFVWEQIAGEAVEKFPFKIDRHIDGIEKVDLICNQYKNLIENNGLWKFFHNNDGTHKKESFAQMLFFAIACSYCDANNLDISPEANSGNGPIDFKISKGSNIKINIEMKLSSNTKLLSGYEKQLPAYNQAEKTNKSKFIIMQLYDKDLNRIQKVLDFKNKSEKNGIKLPDIIIIDATKRESASKRT
ncbi:hypothetical protein [Campylobacter sp. RM16190]|uniref:hypothetical protein n=1 Tax=Campylobacter sp. RM16190 TaxID=1705727 RepID=UPI0014755A3B|nr:hypothetical protein [Campylobacter sp. RM16190]